MVNVVLKSAIVEKLSARGILAYVAMAIAGPGASTEKLALAVHVRSDVMEDCLLDVRRLQNSESLFPSKKQAGKAKEAVRFVLPQWIDTEDWTAFEEMRAKIKKPMTDRARAMLIGKLERFRNAGHSVQVMIRQSVINNWQDFYEPREASASVLKAAPKLRETEFRV
jgi:hypothetical protein